MNNKRYLDFAESVSFKGMTLNNSDTLLCIANNHSGGSSTLKYQSIADYVGCTKATAKNNVKKLEGLGIVRVSKQYAGYDDKLPRVFTINLKWREL